MINRLNLLQHSCKRNKMLHLTKIFYFCCSEKFVGKLSISSTVNMLMDCKWTKVLPPTHRQTSYIKASHLFPLELERGPFVHIFGTRTCLALSQEKAPVPSLHTEKCSLLYVMLPAGLSIVNTACVVYGNVGHLFVVLLGVRPQVEVDDCRVDVAGLSVSLPHQLAKSVFDQFHRPD